MLIKKGDLIEFTYGPRKGQQAIVTTNPYTHRFMEPEDYEMVEHGMGHMAGVYGTAFNVVIPKNGDAFRIRHSKTKYKIVARAEENNESSTSTR